MSIWALNGPAGYFKLFHQLQVGNLLPPEQDG